jgi:hypothetical protein
MPPSDELVERTSPNDFSIPPSRFMAERKVVTPLYPELKAQERHLAETNLIRYLEIALTIAGGLQHPADHLTHHESVPTMKERSNGNLKS